MASMPPATAADNIRFSLKRPRSTATGLGAGDVTNTDKKGSISATCAGSGAADDRHGAVADDGEARPVIRMRGRRLVHQGELRAAQSAGRAGAGRRGEQARDEALGRAEIARHRPV